MQSASGPDIAAVYDLLARVAHTVSGHDGKLDDLSAASNGI
jgi:hypothetical protein